MNRSLGGLALVLSASSLLAACAAAAPVPPPATAKPAEPVCPSGSGWNGAQCVRTLVVTEVTCPAGSTWNGAQCAGKLVTDCPAGTRFTDGIGCVAELAIETPPARETPPTPVSRTTEPPAAGQSPTVSVAGNFCGCATSDLICQMKCAAGCRDGTGPQCRTPPEQGATLKTGKDFDRGAASTALAAAAAAAKRCAGLSGSVRARVLYAPNGRVTTVAVEGAPIAGTAQGGCIAASFRNATIPAFDGSPVAVTKNVSIP